MSECRSESVSECVYESVVMWLVESALESA
jgi:hypothetical protein